MKDIDKILASLMNNEKDSSNDAIKAFSSILYTFQEKIRIGDMLGKVGDPRLSTPKDSQYWVQVELEYTSLLVGKYPVTTQEWRSFIEGEDYHNDELWSAEGLAWKSKKKVSWLTLAQSPKVVDFIHLNQPVVGVSWYEAEAYANLHGARLPDCQERIDIVRGKEKRVYPWGKSFGHGNSNTKEQGLERPAAVGVFIHDRTPDGVCDLAGNVGEWTSEVYEGKARIHPGAWSHDMMSSWSKAFDSISPAARLNDLGFRLVKDL